VLVRGLFAGWWYEAAQNREGRWGISDFGVAEEFLSAGPVEITVEPPGGSPLWSVSEMTIFALMPE
jgi:hypothetical protein